MKDDINLVPTFVERTTSQNFALDRLYHRLKVTNIFAATSLLIIGIVLIIVIYLGKIELDLKNHDEDKIASLSADSKLINSVAIRQSQLASIKKMRPNLRGKVDLVQKTIPKNVTLINLSVNNDGLNITAQTNSVQAFSYFINSLKNERAFKKISLVGSSYDYKSGLFLFTLECSTN